VTWKEPAPAAGEPPPVSPAAIFFLPGGIIMNATAIPVQELIGQLLDAADGILADTAAVQLIISHENFLHHHAFRRIINAGISISTGQPLATIGWDAALRALDTGLMPCASSDQAILRIAASLGNPAIPVHLRTVLGNLDTRNITLVAGAITAANG
jgi:hypothetical protein